MHEHGSFKLRLQGQIIVLTVIGAWNVETALRMCKEFKLLAESIKGQPYACISDLSDWQLGTPEMWKPIKELNTWANNNNLKYEAVICNLSIQKTLIGKSNTVFTEVESKFFENINEGYQWLESLGIN